MSPISHPEKKLPVTGEIGSEGGSYAEPANQVATFSGPASPNVPPADAVAGQMSIATDTAARGIESGDDTASGIIRYPTEPPSPPDAREGRKMSGHPWRTGLIGLAAGTAAWIGVSRIRRRASVRSERDEGVDPRGAPRRQVAGGEPDPGE
jgi:hypothetical protein